MPDLLPGTDKETKYRTKAYRVVKCSARFLATNRIGNLILLIAAVAIASYLGICLNWLLEIIPENTKLYDDVKPYVVAWCPPEVITSTPTMEPPVTPTIVLSPTDTPTPTIHPSEEWALVITAYNEDECWKARDYASRLQTMNYPVVVVHDIGADEKTNWHVMLFDLTENQAEAMKNEFPISYTLKPFDVAYYKNCRISSSACVEHIECE